MIAYARGLEIAVGGAIESFVDPTTLDTTRVPRPLTEVLPALDVLKRGRDFDLYEWLSYKRQAAVA